MNSYKLHIEEEARSLGLRLASDPISVDDLQPAAFSGQTGFSPWEHSINDGSKFAGGFGPTQILFTDYWTLRQRSAELFEKNLYGRGLVRRLVTNIINTGLTPEATPEESVIGVPEDSLQSWTEDVETRHALWAKSPKVCDYLQKDTFGAIQRNKLIEALVGGDALVVLRQSRRTRLPSVQIISGDKVISPLSSDSTIRKGNTVVHGVERDARKRDVGFWVRQADGKVERIPAFGERSGRRIAWLVYGTDKRMDEVRGQPLLGIVLQSLKEIDRYRDSTQRKAVVNSMIALFIKKTEDKIGTLPLQGGATRVDSVAQAGTTTNSRTLNAAAFMPGVGLEELNVGEEPVLLGGQGTDVNYGEFETAVLRAVAWAHEIPPEIMELSFSSNYSASQAAINEFKIFMNMRWSIEDETFCGPIYQEWLVSEVLLGKIQAPGLLEAWRDPNKFDIFAAWVSADWYGSIKPSTDMLKQVKASDLLVNGAYSTRAREARIMTGSKYARNVKRLKRENEQLVEAQTPLAEFRARFNLPDEASTPSGEGAVAAIEERLDDFLDNLAQARA